MEQKIKCEVIGLLNGGGYERMHDIARRVYGTDGLAPTMHTCGGGNLEPKILEPLAYDEQNGYLRQDGCVGTLTTDGNSPKHNNRIVEPNYELSDTLPENTNVAGKDLVKYRIRKLTERECFRLMGVKEEDYEKVAKNQSMSSRYHLAGDSIVTTCLMAIFGLLLEVDYKAKITELTEELKEK